MQGGGFGRRYKDEGDGPHLCQIPISYSIGCVDDKDRSSDFETLVPEFDWKQVLLYKLGKVPAHAIGFSE